MPRRENPYACMVDGLAGAEFRDLSSAVATRACRDEVGFGTFDEAVEAWKPDSRFPWCHYEHNHRNSSTLADGQRRACAEYGRTYTTLTSKVFEGPKDLAT